MTEITGVRADIITALIGEGELASDALIKSLADSIRDRREHEHDRWDDVFCADKVATAGERMAPVLRRLIAAEATATELRAQLTCALTYFELRRGTPDDLMPLVLGQYTAMDDATAHGLDAYADDFGHADRLTWYPADDTETVHHLYATTDGDEVQTEWHVVTRTIDASYDPDSEG